MKDKEAFFSKVRRLEITAKHEVLDLFSGMYLSAFKGRGIELEDVREFQTGDDIRAISWAKTAQLGKPYVKEFREERDLLVMLLADVSGSLSFGSHYERKRERLAEVGALLTFAAIYNHDRVGLVLFSDGVQKEIAPRRGMRHGARIIRELLSFTPESPKTSIAKTLDSFNMAMKKRAICFLLSDFMDENYEKQFGFAAKKDDLVAVRLFDSMEMNLPHLTLCHLQNLETKKRFLVDVDADVARRVSEEAKKRENTLHSLISKYGASGFDVDTKGTFLEQVVAYFKMRKRHRR